MNRKLTRTGILACAVLHLATPASAGDANAKNPISEKTYGSWTQHCLTREEGKQCILHQKALDEDKKVILVAEITAQGNTPDLSMRIVAPLGIILLIPLRVTIDDKNPADLPYTRCIPDGCMTDVLLTTEAVEKMKAGKKMVLTYTLPNQQTVNAKLSLDGLTAGIKAMPNNTQ